MKVFDITYLDKDLNRESLKKAWDTLHLLSAMQGLANRNGAQLYYLYKSLRGGKPGSLDRFWLDKMTEEGAFLAKEPIVQIPSFNSLLEEFISVFDGIVLYDGNVPATSCVATTIAGVENLAPVRYDPDPGSVYSMLTKKLNVKKRLLNADGSPMFTGKGIIPGTCRPSTGSAKCDAYIWAKMKYLDKGLCSKEFMGYYIDYAFTGLTKSPSLNLATLTNIDFQVMHKGFVFDLGVWDDEAVIDDPEQEPGLDLATFKELLLSQYLQSGGNMVQISGFTPWNMKYTRTAGAMGQHGDVDTEWRHAELLSNYNCYMDADAIGSSDMTNASVFCQCPLRERYETPKSDLEDLKRMGAIDEDGQVKKTNFVSIYVGDYDSAAWLYQNMPRIWESPKRGAVPLGWALNPNLSLRFAFGMDYFRRTATVNDTFVAGDNGAGYLNPGALSEPRRFSGLPSGVEKWREHNKKWFDIFDLSCVGFVIDGFAPKMTDELLELYADIAPDGIGGQLLPSKWGVYDKLPYIVMEDGQDPARYKEVCRNLKRGEVTFTMLRNILWMPEAQEEYMANVTREMEGDVMFLEPYAFFRLMKYFIKGEAE